MLVMYQCVPIHNVVYNTKHNALLTDKSLPIYTNYVYLWCWQMADYSMTDNLNGTLMASCVINITLTMPHGALQSDYGECFTVLF